MTCSSYGIQSKTSRRNSLFPKASRTLGTEYPLLLLRISSQWTRQTVEPTWSLAALAKASDRKYFLPTHLRLLLLAFLHFFREGTAQPNQRNKENCVRKICSCRARTRPKFSHISLLVQTPNPLVQALET